MTNDKRTREQLLTSLWQEFENLFPDEQDCLKEFHRRSMLAGQLKCRYCGTTPENLNLQHRFIRCHICKKEFWLTAGTFFAGMKEPKPWLGAIWLMERGVILNSSRFHKLAGIAQSSAWYMLKKLTMVLMDNMVEGSIVVPSSLFYPVFGKRSRETPARRQPDAEEDELENVNGSGTSNQDSESSTPGTRPKGGPIENSATTFGNNETMTRSGSSCSDLPTPNQLRDQDKVVLEALSQGPIHFDVLCERTKMTIGELSESLLNLEFAALITCLPGGRYSLFVQDPKRKTPAMADVHEESIPAAAEFLEMVRINWHAISRKYLQPYLAAQWFHSDIDRRHGLLLEACARSEAITQADIIAYVSPRFVKMTLA